MDFSLLNATVLGTFGETIMVDGVELPAIFDSRHYPTEDGVAGTSDLITTVSLRTADLPEIDDDTVFTARGVDYAPWDARPDGEGITTIVLKEVP